MFSYSAFGLTLRANVPVPGLVPLATPSSGPTVSIQLGALPPSLGVEGEPSFATDGLALLECAGHTVFAYADGTRFVVRDDGGAIWGSWPPPLTVEDASTYLLGPVISFALRRHGRLCLHAGVFAREDRAVAVAGGPEAGKSTLLGALALRGVRVLSDDVAPLSAAADGTLVVSPSYPRVRLWDDAVVTLFGASGTLPLLTPNWSKRFLDLGPLGLFEDRALPLAAVFVLGDRAAERAPRVEVMSARDSFVAVLAHLHSVWMRPRAPQAGVFELARRVVERVPVLRLVPHRDPARLSGLCDVLLEAADELAPVAGGADVPAR